MAKVSQVKVRYTYNKCLRKMQDLELWEVYEIFMVIRENLNTIRRTYRGENQGQIPIIV